MEPDDLPPLEELQPPGTYSAPEVASGPQLAPTARIHLYEPDEWELFTLEWVYSRESEYTKIQRFGGPGDKGRDVVAFVDDARFEGVWDNFQCKLYRERALRPADIWPEIAKIIYYSYTGYFSLPRKCYFVAPKGVGTALSDLLDNPPKLRAQLLAVWDAKCSGAITSPNSIPLDSALRAYIESIDFAMFDYIPLAQMVRDHRATQFYAIRFGGGLPARPPPDPPPDAVDDSEIRYTEQLLDAYSDHLRAPITHVSDMSSRPDLQEHFRQSREAFYSAEALRRFARDTVPPGTFNALQDEVHDGVIDECQKLHEDGLARVRATTQCAALLPLNSNALIQRTTTKDKKGICHQLANFDRLVWVKANDDS